MAFTNPYNIGDRVRIDGGDVLYVRRIRTYTTEFESMHGKPVRMHLLLLLLLMLVCGGNGPLLLQLLFQLVPRILIVLLLTPTLVLLLLEVLTRMLHLLRTPWWC